MSITYCPELLAFNQNFIYLFNHQMVCIFQDCLTHTFIIRIKVTLNAKYNKYRGNCPGGTEVEMY